MPEQCACLLSRDSLAAWRQAWSVWRAIHRSARQKALAPPLVDECVWWIGWLARRPAWPWRWLRSRLLRSLYAHADPRLAKPGSVRELRGAVYRVSLAVSTRNGGWSMRVR